MCQKLCFIAAAYGDMQQGKHFYSRTGQSKEYFSGKVAIMILSLSPRIIPFGAPDRIYGTIFRISSYDTKPYTA
jgi:hypothetical protein